MTDSTARRGTGLSAIQDYSVPTGFFRLHRSERSNMRCRLRKQADARLILMHVIEDVSVTLRSQALALANLSVSEFCRHLEEDAAYAAQSGVARRRACLVPP